MSKSSEHHHTNYVKIWAILCVLLVVSIIGPELGNKWLTLITAFGIAIVKALIVAAYFMHLNIEKKFVWYIMFTMLLCVGLFFAGTAADIMKPSGTNWVNAAGEKVVEEHHKTWKKKYGDHGAGKKGSIAADEKEH